MDRVKTVSTAKAIAALITVNSPRLNSRENSFSANLAHIRLHSFAFFYSN